MADSLQKDVQALQGQIEDARRNVARAQGWEEGYREGLRQALELINITLR